LIFISSQNQQNSVTTILGEELSSDIVEPDAEYMMYRPDGMSEKMIPERSGASLAIKYHNAKIPGIYKLTKHDQVFKQWAVNVNPLESNMEKIPLSKVKDALGGQSFELAIQADFSEQINQYRFGSEITIWFFVIALALMVIEMLLSREDLFRKVNWLNRFLKDRNNIK
jgi:hypothetical protein